MRYAQVRNSRTQDARSVGANRFSRLHRLEGSAYRGEVAVHWSMATERRSTGWLSDLAHAKVREALLHVAARYDLWCPAYCLMPDHAHVIWIGTSDRSDQLKAIAFLRRRTHSEVPGLVWQRQPFDHVLKQEEMSRDGIASVCHYVFENSVQAKFVERREDYRYWGSCLLGYPDVDPRRTDFWDVFWTLFLRETSNVRALRRAATQEQEAGNLPR